MVKTPAPNKVQILVVTHKQYNRSVLDDCYKTVSVSPDYEGDYCDWEGENISKKNPYYCELTAMYWGWKNLKCDICGINHYRRYFFKNIYAKDVASTVLRQKDIVHILSYKDVILPLPFVPRPKSSAASINSFVSFLMRAETKGLIDFDFIRPFQRYLSAGFYPGCNMFIAKKTTYDAFCQWLFPLLLELEDYLQEKNQYDKRCIGYWSEHLVSFYFLHLFPASRIAFMPVVTLGRTVPNRWKSILNTLGIVRAKWFLNKRNFYRTVRPRKP